MDKAANLKETTRLKNHIVTAVENRNVHALQEVLDVLHCVGVATVKTQLKLELPK